MQNTSGDMAIDQAVSTSQMNLQSTSGDIAIGSLTAETITILADQGSITDAADDNLVDIQSDDLSLKASGNIADLELNIKNTIEAVSTKAGDITLYGLENLILNNVSAVDGQ
jgi:hypothetical protein